MLAQISLAKNVFWATSDILPLTERIMFSTNASLVIGRQSIKSLLFLMARVKPYFLKFKLIYKKLIIFIRLIEL